PRHEARGELEVSTHYHGAFEVSIAADTRRHGSSLVKRCRANTERGESVLWTRRTKLAADPNKHQRCWSKSSNLSVVPENGRDPPPLIISLTAMLCDGRWSRSSMPNTGDISRDMIGASSGPKRKTTS